MMDANEQRVDAESEDHETEQMDQPWRVKIIALSGTVVEEVEVAEICTASVGLVALLAPRAAAKMRVDVSRLRFSLSGRVLDIWDTWHELGEPRELQLVVLPFCNDFKDELLEAVSGQDLDQVNQVLGRLQDPNARSRDHVSAFMKASILGQPEIMVALYGAGADVDAEDLAGLTALHCAVRDARLETVRLLLNLRSNVDARNKLGRTPLFEAVSTGCVAMVQALATAAADPDSADRDGGTPLRAAVAAGFLEAVEILVNALTSANDLSTTIVFAASIQQLEHPGSWNSRRPCLEAVLGGVQEETEPAEWDEKRPSCARDSGWIPSGRECPWRFNAVMLFTTSVEELQSESGLSFRLRVQNDISLGIVKVQLPTDIVGEATADLLRHVLPVCSPVQVQDWFRWASAVQMVSLKGSDGTEVGQVAVSFAVDADPRELMSSASSGARPRAQRKSIAPRSWWLDWHCCTSASGRRICSEECDEEHKDRKDASMSLPATLIQRLDPPSLPPPEQAPEGWISRRGPGGRVFWHHKALGPAPWEQQVPSSLTSNRVFFRSIMGKVADLSDENPLSSEIF